MNTGDDEQLVAKYLAGDDAAFEVLLTKYSPRIYNFVARYVGYGPNAEDATQEIFIKIWKKLTGFNPAKKFKSWLFAVARNTAIDLLRKRRITTLVDNDFGDEENNNAFADFSPTPLEQAAQWENAELVSKAMRALPEIYHTILNLYYLEELTLAEIAKILNEPINTVKSRHRRALIKLRSLLAAEPRLDKPL